MPAVYPVAQGNGGWVFPFKNGRFEKLVIMGRSSEVLLNQIVHRGKRRPATLKSFVYCRKPFFINELNLKSSLPKIVSLVICEHSACGQFSNFESRRSSGG